MIYRQTGRLPIGIADEQVAGAWVVFDKHGNIQSQFNTSSITDTGAGDWTVTWTIPFAATTYALAGCTKDLVSGSEGTILCVKTGDSITTSSVAVVTADAGGGRVDPTDEIYLVAIGRR